MIVTKSMMLCCGLIVTELLRPFEATDSKNLQQDISLEIGQNNGVFLSRKRRYLMFPEGSSFQLGKFKSIHIICHVNKLGRIMVISCQNWSSEFSVQYTGWSINTFNTSTLNISISNVPNWNAIFLSERQSVCDSCSFTWLIG